MYYVLLVIIIHNFQDNNATTVRTRILFKKDRVWTVETMAKKESPLQTAEMMRMKISIGIGDYYSLKQKIILTMAHIEKMNKNTLLRLQKSNNNMKYTSKSKKACS